jgi:hypothetical protein
MEMARIRDAGPVVIAGIAGIAMGMAITKKMMGGRMGGLVSKSPMAKMMGMCAEMLTTIRQTNALAVIRHARTSANLCRVVESARGQGNCTAYPGQQGRRRPSEFARHQ